MPKQELVATAVVGNTVITLIAGVYAHGDGSPTWYGRDEEAWEEPFYIVRSTEAGEPERMGMEYSAFKEAETAFLREIGDQLDMLTPQFAAFEAAAAK